MPIFMCRSRAEIDEDWLCADRGLVYADRHVELEDADPPSIIILYNIKNDNGYGNG